jgi:hypothetical protein
MRLMSRLRDERGITLMEVLSAATVGFVVLAGVFGLLESSVRLNTGVLAKTDSMQRGRIGMDKLTQQLRSQVCLDLDNPAILAGATDTSVTFYADFSTADISRPPEKRTVKFDPATNNISALIYKTAVAKPTPGDYPALSAPTTSDLVFEHAGLSKDEFGATVPFLTYYAYETVGVTPHPEPTLLLPAPLDATEAARVARIDIQFVAFPTGSNDVKNAVNMTDQISVRHADPNLPAFDPACV